MLSQHGPQPHPQQVQVQPDPSLPGIAAIATEPTAADDGSGGTPAKRGRGRPKGSKNKEKPLDPNAPPEPPKRPRGRPRKNPLPDGADGGTPTATRPRGRPRKDGLPPGSLNHSVSAPVGQQSHSDETSISASQPIVQTRAKQKSASSHEWDKLSLAAVLTDLVTQLSTTHAFNPTSSEQVGASQSPQQVFASHLQNLASTKESQYSKLQTFWLPHSHPYFAMIGNVSSAPRTAPFVSVYRFFYWDPFTLVFDGLRCPDCFETLRHDGLCSSGPIGVRVLLFM